MHCSFLVDTTGLIGVEPPDGATTDAPVDVATPMDAESGAADASDAGDADVKSLPDGASVFGGNGHAYLLVVDENKMTWEEASTRATAMGGHLATLTSAPENDFAFALCAKVDAAWPGGYGPWLGGMQAQGASEPGGNWGWVTGEPFVYSAWAASEPSNSGGNESRIHFWGGDTGRAATWNDNMESFRNGAFIVEFEP